jgi:hypothetical protein
MQEPIYDISSLVNITNTARALLCSVKTLGS